MTKNKISIGLLISFIFISSHLWASNVTTYRYSNQIPIAYPASYFQLHVCGNGMKENGEECDDHNTVNWDGCSSTCKIEIYGCGNGILEPGEQCDDGNTDGKDGCSSACLQEPSWICYGELGSISHCDPVGAP